MENQKPCAVQKIETSQGFSVSYQNHLLYSKYNPKKNILSIVENIQLLPGTIILCNSPLLGYGIAELLQKLPENCLLMLCEAEKALYDFSVLEGVFECRDDRLLYCEPENLNNLPLRLYELAKTGLYKRVTRIDMSAGTQFHKDFYDKMSKIYKRLHLKGYEQLMYKQKMQWKETEIDCYGSVDIDKLNALFVDYINYGGYPEVVFSDKIQENPGQFIRHDIIDKVLLRDLPSLYGINDVQELNSLFTMIAYHSGGQFSYESMSKESGVRKDLLRQYIGYLEAAFFIRKIHRTDDNAKRYQRETSFKIYLTNPSLRCALFQPIKVSDEEIGNLVETAVFAQWIPRQGVDISFANWRLSNKQQGEVDIVGIDAGLQKPQWAVEIKWSDRYAQNPGELESLLWYMPKNGLTDAIVTSETVTLTKKMQQVTLHFMPVACYAYTVASNTLKNTRMIYGL